MSLELMRRRIDISGNNIRTEQINDAKKIIEYDFINDVSYNPDIVMYQTDKHVMIKMYDQKHNASYGFTSQFMSSQNFPVNLGDILFDTKRNIYWLCIESYDVDGIHFEGKLGKCNRFLKWQEQNGNIYEIPVISTNATQYNNGEYKDFYMSIGSDQIMLFTQLNEHTVKLDHGIKFMFDENRENPTVYELTKPDTVDYSYMGKGMISLMLTEYAYKPSDTELKFGVCDYFDPDTTLPLPDETGISSALISGFKNIKPGYRRTYTVSFTDKNGEKIEWEHIDFNWSVISDFSVNYETRGNKIDITVDDGNLIGSSFILRVVSNGCTVAEEKILVVPIA